MWRVVLAAAVSAALFPASAAADNTPVGPATLLYEWNGPVTAEGRPPAVMVAADAVVGEGGKAGAIRIRAGYAGVMAVGDRVQLPAEPGTYRFPAPHIRWDYRRNTIGLDQETGEHAVLAQKPCDPSLGQWDDPCNLERVNVWTPPGAQGDPTQVRKAAKLAVRGIWEYDVDLDLAGDESEDRTDLRLSATTPARDRDGRVRIALTITNAGPRAADLPSVATSLADARIVDDTCRREMWRWRVDDICLLSRSIASGESRTVTLESGSREAVATTISVHSEGPDLAGADNAVRVDVPAATPIQSGAPFRLSCAKSSTLRKGVKVRIRSEHDGQVRVTLSLRNGKVKLAKAVTLKARVSRTVTFRPTGAKLRALRRAHRRSLPARVTLRARGQAPVTVRTAVRL